MKAGVVFVLGCCFAQAVATAQLANVSAPAYLADRIMVQPKHGIAGSTLANFHSAQHGKVLRTFERFGGMEVIELPTGESVPALVAKYQQSGLVEFAEPDYIYHASATPNDPKYVDGTMYWLNNTGQSNGVADADIDAPEGWDVTNSATNLIVAVLDTGIRYTHEDLSNNVWVNPSNGLHGFNALVPTNEPADDNGHGTLVSGWLAAEGNNGKGVVGVMWHGRIMACKCLGSGGTGNGDDIIAAIDFAVANGAKVINASLDSTGFSVGMSNAIAAARDAGIIFVASCGNGNPGQNVDLAPTYPACYNIDNVVSVAYTTRTDALANLSNYGATNVDLAAPGDQIYSTYYTSDSAYFPNSSFITFAGTSYAAPLVSGTCALVWAKYPAENYQQIIARVLNGTDPLPSLAGKCVTGGRLNLRKALSPPILLTLTPPMGITPSQLHVTCGPNRTCIVQVSPNLSSWTNIFTNSTTTNLSFNFPDPQSTNTAPRYYRALSTL